MKQVLLRIRRKNGYKRPKNFIHSFHLISNILILAPMLQGLVNVNDGFALILSSELLINILNESDEIYIDGTFKVCLFIY